MVTIAPCLSKKELKTFEQIPEILHGSDPYFVPPFPGSIVKLIDDKSPIRRMGAIYPFLAYKDGKPVGRIAAIINRNHNDYYKDKTGFFGFFEFANDLEVARALLERAKVEVKTRGMESLRGPYSPTVNDECGLLVDGFETTPFVLMPYNPTYYLTIYDRLGLKAARDLYAYYISTASGMPERIEKIVKRVKRTTGIEVRNINLKKLSSELKIIQKLYNETLDRNWGFVPLSVEELEFAADDLKSIVDPSFVLIAEKDGVAVGFSLVIPNINEFMWRAKSSKGLMRILRFAWYLKTQSPKEARLTVLGVSPEFRNKGVAALFYYESFMRGKNKFVGGELSWIEESNEEMCRAIEVMGGQKYKSYRIFETGMA